MKKKKVLKIMIPLFVVVVVVAIVIGVVMYNNSNRYIEPSTPNNTQDYTIITTEQEPQRETIGNILSTGKASTKAFCNGYSVVRYEDVAYIINTKGEILSSFHRDSKYWNVLFNVSDWNFYDDIAVFVSDYGTISFPVENKNNAINYWYKSDESQVLDVTDENLLIVIETTQTVDGSSTKIGVQDYLGNWVKEAQETCIESLRSSEHYYTTSLGDGVYLIEIRYHYSSGGYHLEQSYLYDINSGEVQDLDRKIPETPVYYKDDFNYRITRVSPLKEGVQVIFVRNADGVLFAIAIDENGNQIYDPIQVNSDIGGAVYSDGLLALTIKEKNNKEYILYVDKSGNEVCKIPDDYTDAETCEYNSGIICNGSHYYDSTGKLLFE